MLNDRDSFDYYTTVADRWTAVGLTVGSVSIGAFGRKGTNGLRLTNVRNGAYRSYASGETQGVIGRSVKVSALTANMHLIGIANNAVLQVTIGLSTNGEIVVSRGSWLNGGTVLGTSAPATISAGEECYIEVKFVLHDTTGSVVVRKNGSSTAVLTLTNQDTNNGQGNFMNRIYIGYEAATTPNTAINMDCDDFYFCDLSGTYNNDFLGDVRVEADVPDADGGTMDFTPSAGSAWQCVDDAGQHNSDTDYISSSTPGHKALFSGTALSAADVVKAVSIISICRKDDAGTRELRNIIKHSSSTANGATVAQGTNYAYQEDNFETNPSTGNPWTPAEVDACEFGVEVVT